MVVTLSWLTVVSFLILGGQIHNSSAWTTELPQVWESMARLHANTIEAPVYWEQSEPQEGHFDFTNVDQIVEGARSHDLRVDASCGSAPGRTATCIMRYPG